MNKENTSLSEENQSIATTTPVFSNISSMERFIPITGDRKRTELVEIEPDKLVPYSEHKILNYEGKYFDDKLDSIRSKGIMNPITVRPHPTQDGKYEILAGHTRVWAAKEVGLLKIPAYRCQGLSDVEAKIFFQKQIYSKDRSMT